jgi:CHRD domain
MKRSISRWDVIVAGCLAGIAALTGPSQAAPVSFTVTSTGARQVPPVETAGIGTANLTYDPGRRLMTWSLTYDGLSGPAMTAHIHGPAAQGRNGPPVIWLTEKSATGPQTDRRASHADRGAGATIDGRRVVHQRAYPS